MISFLPISILAYALNGGSAVIDKILLNKLLPSPFVYAFYICIFGGLFLLAIPFGIIFSPTIILLSAVSGIFFVTALLSFYMSLKLGEASVVTPIVGSLNPLFTVLFGFFLLHQLLKQTQLLGIAVLIVGALILSSKVIKNYLKPNKQFALMIASGLSFAISYLALSQTYQISNFLTGLSLKSIFSALVVTIFLSIPKIRGQIFSSKIEKHHFANKTTYLLFAGQAMGGASGLLINYGVSLASPAVVNSLFGVQYLIILGVAFFLSKEHHPKLLGENLTKGAVFQKLIGVIILSFGIYLLSL